MKVVAITGGKKSGKSTLIRQIKEDLLIRPIEVDGLLTYEVFQGESLVGLDLLHIKTNELLPLARIGFESSIKTQRFGFYPEAFDIQLSILSLINKPETIILLDEIGVLELRDLGWHPLMVDISQKRYKAVILVLRKNIFCELTKKYNLRYDLLVDLDSTDFNLETLKQRIVYFIC